jgi:hypothetical protein
LKPGHFSRPSENAGQMPDQQSSYNELISKRKTMH